MTRLFVGVVVLASVLWVPGSTAQRGPRDREVMLWSTLVPVPLNLSTLGYCTLFNTHPAATVSYELLIALVPGEEVEGKVLVGQAGQLAPLQGTFSHGALRRGEVAYCSARLRIQEATDHINPPFVRAALLLYEGTTSGEVSVGMPVLSSPLY